MPDIAAKGRPAILLKKTHNRAAQAVYVARRPFVAFGKSFAQGDTVEVGEVGLGMLSKLHGARIIVARPQEEWE